MKMKPIALSLCLILAACGGGTQGPAGAPGKSAYQIWLDQGNVGTEQDFLDSLVSGGTTGDTNPDEKPTNPDEGNNEYHYFTNTHEYQEYLKNADGIYSDFVEKNMPWPKHDGYKQYSHKILLPNNISSSAIMYTYHEKELNLGNYGVYTYASQSDFDADFNLVNVFAYIHNREGVGINVYTPQSGTVFSGGTLAYLHPQIVSSSPNEIELIKGDATFTYSPTNPILELAYDNYYNIKFSRTNDGTYNVDIAGSNLTGKPEYNLPTGSFSDKGITTEFGYVSKNGTEEAFGIYQENFYDGAYDKTGVITSDFYLTGAFGGTKQ